MAARKGGMAISRHTLAAIALASSLGFVLGAASCQHFALLRRALVPRIGHTGVGARFMATLWSAALASAIVAWGIKLASRAAWPTLPPAVVGPLVLVPFGGSYFALTAALGVPHAAEVVRAVLRRRG